MTTDTRQFTRAEIVDNYDIELPEDMGDGPFNLFAIIDVVMRDGKPTEYPCTVAVIADYAYCLTCHAQGHLDGYPSDADGVERWHRDL